MVRYGTVRYGMVWCLFIRHHCTFYITHHYIHGMLKGKCTKYITGVLICSISLNIFAVVRIG